MGFVPWLCVGRAGQTGGRRTASHDVTDLKIGWNTWAIRGTLFEHLPSRAVHLNLGGF